MRPAGRKGRIALQDPARRDRRPGSIGGEACILCAVKPQQKPDAQRGWMMNLHLRHPASRDVLRADPASGFRSGIVRDSGIILGSGFDFFPDPIARLRAGEKLQTI